MANHSTANESGFPAKPVAPRVFVEDVIPSLFADLELSAVERTLDYRVAIVLTGDGGGDWTLHFVEGELGVAPGRAPESDVTLLQSVADWRSGLWPERPGAAGDWMRAGARPIVDRETLGELRSLRGRVDIRVAAGTGERSGEAWQLALAIGPGAIPDSPDATIEIAADQAEAIQRGALHPLEALMTGELRLEGDLGLVFQLQALALRAGLAR